LTRTGASSIARSGASCPAGGSRAAGAARRLAALSPLEVLGRGYAIVEDGSGRVRSDAAGLMSGAPALLRMRDGRVDVTVGTVTLHDDGGEGHDGAR